MLVRVLQGTIPAITHQLRRRDNIRFRGARLCWLLLWRFYIRTGANLLPQSPSPSVLNLMHRLLAEGPVQSWPDGYTYHQCEQQLFYRVECAVPSEQFRQVLAGGMRHGFRLRTNEARQSGDFLPR